MNPWLHRFSIVAAVCALVLIASGAWITSERGGAQGVQQSSVQTLATSVHLWVAVVTCIMTVSLSAWLSFATPGGLTRWLGWLALVILGLDGWTGWQQSLGLFHASLAPLYFAVITAIVVQTSTGWMLGTELVDHRGVKFLRPLAIAAPGFLMLQILLGTAYRHKLASIMPHMGGAMIAALATLVPAMVIIQQYPGHKELHSAAVALITVVLTQVTLGVTAFIMELLEVGDTAMVIIVTSAHVVVGSLTLAASLVLAMRVRHYIRRRFE